MLAPMSPILFVGGGLLGLREGTLDPSVTDVNTGSELAGGGLCVMTKHGTSPSGPLPPYASIELS